MSNPSAQALSRRALLGAAGTGALALAGLSGCTGGGDPAPAPSGGAALQKVAAGTHGSISVQLRSIAGLDFAGLYQAVANGHYADAGFDKVEFLPGPVDSVEDVVVDKGADIGISGPVVTSGWLAEHDSDLRLIGSTLQDTPYAVISLQDAKPMRHPSDLVGKRIGISPGTDRQFLAAFCTLTGVEYDALDLVDVNGQLAPLEERRVDGIWGYLADEPLRIRADGFVPAVLALDAFGLNIPSFSFVASRDTIDERKDMVKAFLAASALGWKDVAKDPGGTAALIIADYGADTVVDEALLTEQIKVQNGLVNNADTAKYGLFTSTKQAQVETLAALGLIGSVVSMSQLFNFAPLTELYREQPALINS